MGAHILLVEDNPTNRDLITYLLTAFGHNVSVAASGEAGLDMLSAGRPDLIICDLNLPGISGYEVVRRVKLDPALSAIAIVAVTAMAMVGEREKVLAAGFDGYLSKPIDPETFSQQLDRFMPAELRSIPPASLRKPATPRPASRPPPAVTMLILDSLGQNGAFMRGLLAGMGFNLLSASDVPGALSLARSELPDLIVTDAPIAPEHFCDFLRAARADVALLRTPFIYLASSAADESNDTKTSAFGVTIISRAIAPNELRKQILACLPAPIRPIEPGPIKVGFVQ